MAFALVIVFLIAMVLSFFEERLMERDKVISFILIGIALILIAGTRGVFDTPDSWEYEDMFYDAGSGTMMEAANEPTFRFFSITLRDAGFGINALFFLYAIISIPLHLRCLWKMSTLPMMSLVVYLSYYYQMHDLVQMRCSVASVLFLFAVHYYREQKKYAFLCILVGIFFHYSAAAGFLIFLFDNKEWSGWKMWASCLIVPVGLVVYYSGIDISYLIPEGMGGDKLETYRKLKDSGIEDELAGWELKTNAVIWLNVLLFYGAIAYRKTLAAYCPYTHLMIKILALAFVCLFFLHNVSAVLASRLCDYFEVVSIILWTSAVYAFTPLIAGKIVINSASLVRFVLSMLYYAMALLTLDR